MSMKKYIVASKFAISKQNGENWDLKPSKDAQGNPEIVEFDGNNVKWRGQEFELPRLQLAIAQNWLVPEGSSVTSTGPVKAKINLSAATPQQEAKTLQGEVEVSEDEIRVNSVSGRREQMKSAAAGGAAIRKMGLVEQASEGQVVSRISNSRSVRTDVGSLTSQQLAQLDIEVAPSGGDAPAIETNTKFPMKTQSGRVVASIHDRAKTSAISAMKAHVEESLVDTLEFEEDSPVVEALQKEEPSKVEPEDTLDPSTKEGRFAVAKIIHPEFPEWDFSKHWTAKMKDLETFKDNTVFLRAIYACESEALKKRIKKEFELS